MRDFFKIVRLHMIAAFCIFCAPFAFAESEAGAFGYFERFCLSGGISTEAFNAVDAPKLNDSDLIKLFWGIIGADRKAKCLNDCSENVVSFQVFGDITVPRSVNGNEHPIRFSEKVSRGTLMRDVFDPADEYLGVIECSIHSDISQKAEILESLHSRFGQPSYRRSRFGEGVQYGKSETVLAWISHGVNFSYPENTQTDYYSPAVSISVSRKILTNEASERYSLN